MPRGARPMGTGTGLQPRLCWAGAAAPRGSVHSKTISSKVYFFVPPKIFLQLFKKGAGRLGGTSWLKCPSSPTASLGPVGPALPWGQGSEQSPSPPLLPDCFQRDVASSNWTFLHRLRAPGDYRMSFPLQGFLINISIIELN